MRGDKGGAVGRKPPKRLLTPPPGAFHPVSTLVADTPRAEKNRAARREEKKAVRKILRMPPSELLRRSSFQTASDVEMYKDRLRHAPQARAAARLGQSARQGVPPPDTSFLHALTSTPGSILGHYAGAARVAGRVAGPIVSQPVNYLARELGPLGTAYTNPAEYARQARAQTGGRAGGLTLVAPPVTAGVNITREAAKTYAGKSLYNIATGKGFKHPGAAGLELAMLIPGLQALKPLKFGRAAVEGVAAARGAKTALEAKAAYRAAFDNAFIGPALKRTEAQKLLRVARKNTALDVPERQAMYDAIDETVPFPTMARHTKNQGDVSAHIAYKLAPEGEGAAAAARAYREMADSFKEAPTQIHPAGLPRKTVDALNAPRGIAHEAMSADDAGRVSMVASGGKPGAIVLTRDAAEAAQKAGLLVEHDPIPGKYGGDYWHVAKDERAMGLMRTANNLFRDGKTMDGDVVFGQAMGYAPDDVARYVRQKYGLDLPPQPRVLTKEEAQAQGQSAEFLYHGTTHDQAMQILEQGRMIPGQRAPEGVWFAEDPKAAAFFGDSVIQMPRSLVDSPRLPFGNYASERALAFREPLPPFEGIRHALDEPGGVARVRAEIDPHRVPLEHPAPPLDEAATAAQIDKSIEQAKRMKSIDKNPAHLLATFREAYRLAVKGAEFRQWYETSARSILAHVHGDKREADKLAQLFAIYSANAEVPANSVFALRAYDEFNATRKITEGSAPQAKAALKVMTGTPWGGRKTNTFYGNMARHFLSDAEFKKLFGKRKVTVDIWMMRMFGFEGDVPTDAQYTWIEDQITELARQLGWSPEEVQAASWVALKAETEKTSMELASFDFAHAIDTHAGQIRFKTLSPEMEKALPKDLHAQHQQDVLNVLEPLRRIIDIPGVGGHVGPGGAAHYIPLLRTKGDFKIRGAWSSYVIARADRQLAKEASAAYGHVLDLPTVAYGRIFEPKSIGHANAVRLALPDGLSADLAEKISKQVGKGVEIVHTPEGAWLVNNTKLKTIPWLKKIEADLYEVKPGLERSASAVTFDGGIVRRSNYANTLARLQRRQPGAGEALDRLAGDVGRVNERYLGEAAGRARAAERPEPITAARFDRAIARSREGEYGAFLSDTPAEQLLADGWRLFARGPHDEVHWAISAEGDFGYFASNIPGFGRDALDDAINNGAKTLDAYDGFLPRYYEKAGFREVARNPWNDEFAPPNWDYAKYGRPDVVHMAYMPTQEARKTRFVTDDWDEAKKAAQALAESRRGPKTEFSRSGYESPPSPEEQAWIAQHPYRTPETPGAPGARYEPVAPPPVTAHIAEAVPEAPVEIPSRLNEPPVPKGHVRLYRGEGATEQVNPLSNTGRYFTSSREDAVAHASGQEGGQIYYVDLPKADVPKGVPTGGGTKEYLVSRTQAEGKTLVEPMTAGEGGAAIVKGLGQAERMTREQNQLRRIERGIRTREYDRRMELTNDKAYAMKALEGKLPTLEWGRFTEMNQESVDAMVAHIRGHPSLQGIDKTYKKINTESALLSVIAGNLPRKFERQLLRDVFGTAADDIIGSVGFWKKARAAGLNLIGVPRTLLSSFDLSAPLRQGLLFGVSHPIMWGKNFAPMIRAFGSKNFYEAVMKDITERPNFDLYQKGKLPFTDIGANIAHREEQFMSSYAEHIPGIGHVVRGSNRAYVAFLNKSRADLFDHLLAETRKARPDIDLEGPEGEKMLKTLARVVGNATGRGTVKNDTLAKAMPAMNQLLFSPRLLKSRLDVIANPGYYAEVWDNPAARKEALKQLGGLVGAVSAVLGLAYFAGARIVTDPRNADFAKVKIGNRRFDVAGGFQQPVRLIAQLISGKVINSVTGETLSLGTSKFGAKNRLSVFMRFLETKESPPVGVIVNWSRGTDFSLKPFSWKREAYSRLVPLLAQDAYDAYRSGDNSTGDIAAALAVYGIGMWGVGVQTYGPKATKPTAPPSGAGIYSGGSGIYGGSTGIYGGSTSGGGAGIYGK